MTEFRRWLDHCSDKQKDRIDNTVMEIVPYFISQGFYRVQVDFDGGRSQENSVTLERERKGRVEFVILLFHKDRGGRFKISFGAKDDVEPFRWIKAGDLVRYQSEKDSAKWWGPSIFNIAKDKSQHRAVVEVKRYLPSICEFLQNDTNHENIFAWPIEKR